MERPGLKRAFRQLTNRDMMYVFCAARARYNIAEMARQLGCSRQAVYRRGEMLRTKIGGKRYGGLIKKFMTTLPEGNKQFKKPPPTNQIKKPPFFGVGEMTVQGRVREVFESRSRLNEYRYLIGTHIITEERLLQLEVG